MTTNQVLTKWVSKICKCRKVSCKRIFGTEGALIASLGQPHYLKRQKDNTFGFVIICICCWWINGSPPGCFAICLRADRVALFDQTPPELWTQPLPDLRERAHIFWSLFFWKTFKSHSQDEFRRMYQVIKLSHSYYLVTVTPDRPLVDSYWATKTWPGISSVQHIRDNAALLYYHIFNHCIFISPYYHITPNDPQKNVSYV